jgi:hypothetical protein
VTLPAIFAFLVGAGMIGQWAISYRTGQIPELKTEPYRIGFHLAGELATAILLIAAGAGVWTSQRWAPGLYLVAMGMLFYTAIVSPGYFAQKGQWAWVLIFGALLGLGILSTFTLAGNLAR